MSSFEELVKAKTLLGLHDKASLSEIKSRYRNLMRKWHPDIHPDDTEKATQMSAKINNAYKIILDYCKHYEYRFDEEFLKEQHQSPHDWWVNKFGSTGNSI
ncbi:MAG: molecular chaperone DnaJ [Helicobacteraceae bacterium 4484_230]|nr:MAG: molecular chaperone DnaJ [Helicobacteraceae bacterium 4484_230]